MATYLDLQVAGICSKRCLLMVDFRCVGSVNIVKVIYAEKLNNSDFKNKLYEQFGNEKLFGII